MQTILCTLVLSLISTWFGLLNPIRGIPNCTAYTECCTISLVKALSRSSAESHKWFSQCGSDLNPNQQLPIQLKAAVCSSTSGIDSSKLLMLLHSVVHMKATEVQGCGGEEVLAAVWTSNKFFCCVLKCDAFNAPVAENKLFLVKVFSPWFWNDILHPHVVLDLTNQSAEGTVTRLHTTPRPGRRGFTHPPAVYMYDNVSVLRTNSNIYAFVFGWECHQIPVLRNTVWVWTCSVLKQCFINHVIHEAEI